MNCAEAYVKFLCQWLLDNCYDDMEFISQQIDKTCIDRLKMVASTPFERITYSEAVELLIDAVKKGKKFENPVEWGIDLASEHERYSCMISLLDISHIMAADYLQFTDLLFGCRFLTEVKFQKPVIVYNYPKGIKAFYMRLNDDNKTVAAMDVLVPKVSIFTIKDCVIEFFWHGSFIHLLLYKHFFFPLYIRWES